MPSDLGAESATKVLNRQVRRYDVALEEVRYNAAQPAETMGPHFCLRDAQCL
jgi:hypothetical protein